MLTDYTSYAEVRAILGVSSKELADETLALPLYEKLLRSELAEVDSNLGETYTSTLLIPEGSRSVAEQKFIDITQVFSSYSTAKTLLSSLPYFGPKRVGDGRAEAERTTDPFKDTREQVDAAFGTIRQRLITAYTAVGGRSGRPVPRAYFAASGIGTDPVTG
jgi:hypothetical protein